MIGKFQNQIADLPALNNLRYENIFRMYSNETSQYFYNLLRSINAPTEIDEEKLVYYTCKSKLPWPMISYNIYGNIELWWLVCLVNKIDNPIEVPDDGTVLKAIAPNYVKTVLSEIKNKTS